LAKSRRLEVPMKEHGITFKVNGKPRELCVAPNELLLNVIRDDLGLTGTKYGCGLGECGACTVLVDGMPTLACLTLAIAVEGSSIETIEGVAADGTLHRIQKAFLDHGAVQCGFCTPGMIMMSKALLEENSEPTEEEIRQQLRGNLCRCTGYASIVRAVMSCAQREGSNSE
jgi:carbon-monoxide dehydrogenase small subunit